MHDVKRISIGEEGEPLNNATFFHENIDLSKGGRCFEFINSGFLPHVNLKDFYETTNQLGSSNGVGADSILTTGGAVFGRRQQSTLMEHRLVIL
jgi:hypothetical protein